MSYRIQFHTCRDRAVAIRPSAYGASPQEALDAFATFADRLLLGKDLMVDLPDPQPDEHIDQVSLVYADDQTAAVVTSVYLMCPCSTRVTKERATSKLVVPEKQLLIPAR